MPYAATNHPWMTSLFLPRPCRCCLNFLYVSSRYPATRRMAKAQNSLLCARQIRVRGVNPRHVLGFLLSQHKPCVSVVLSTVIETSRQQHGAPDTPPLHSRRHFTCPPETHTVQGYRLTTGSKSGRFTATASPSLLTSTHSSSSPSIALIS